MVGDKLGNFDTSFVGQYLIDILLDSAYTRPRRKTIPYQNIEVFQSVTEIISAPKRRKWSLFTDKRRL